MRVDFYVDIYPGTSAGANLFASTAPTPKVEGARRYRIAADIPDHAFFGVLVGDAPVESVTEGDVGE